MVNGRTAWKGDVQQAQTLSIGSAATADIRLDGPAVIPNHADLSLEQKGGWLCAHAPVSFDGQPVIGWAQLGDLVQLGVGGFSLIVYFSTNSSVAARHAQAEAAGEAPGPAPPAPPAAPAVLSSAPIRRTGLTSIFPAVTKADVRRLAREPPPRKRWGLWSRKAKAPDPREVPQASKPSKGFFKRKPKPEKSASGKSGAATRPPSASPPSAPVALAPAMPLAPSALQGADGGLAGLFALPSAETGKPSSSSPAVLQHRRLGLTIKSWLMILVSGAVGVVTFATREVPRVNAGRGLGIQLVPSAASGRADERRPKKIEPLSPDKVKAAADALISGDISNALTLYKKLSESDAAYAPFVQALKRRVSANCNDPASRRDPC